MPNKKEQTIEQVEKDQRHETVNGTSKITAETNKNNILLHVMVLSIRRTERGFSTNNLPSTFLFLFLFFFLFSATRTNTVQGGK